MKKILATLALAAPAMVFAEGTQTTVSLGDSAQYAGPLGTAITDWITGALPALLGVIGVCIGVRLLYMFVKWLNRASK